MGKGKHDKYDRMLPLKTERGTIVGFVAEDWQLSGESGYRACCQNVTKWTESGEPIPLLNDDPYYQLGYRVAINLICGECGHKVIAHIYRGRDDG